MGIAADLLALADRLARPGPEDPLQASWRKSVSTAYYALFHLLVSEAVQCWSGSPGARLSLERAFDHKRMKEISASVVNDSWKAWSASPPPVPDDLKAVAKAFVDLQAARHQADYDSATTWSQTEAQAETNKARK